jgi:hypothetical protein
MFINFCFYCFVLGCVFGTSEYSCHKWERCQLDRSVQWQRGIFTWTHTNRSMYWVAGLLLLQQVCLSFTDASPRWKNCLFHLEFLCMFVGFTEFFVALIAIMKRLKNEFRLRKCQFKGSKNLTLVLCLCFSTPARSVWALMPPPVERLVTSWTTKVRFSTG